jgi:hypothetical protein
VAGRRQPDRSRARRVNFVGSTGLIAASIDMSHYAADPSSMLGHDYDPMNAQRHRMVNYTSRSSSPRLRPGRRTRAAADSRLGRSTSEV